MLQSIRERATGWIAIVIFSFLLISMGLLGIQTYMGVSDVSNVAAEVNSVSISRDTLGAALQRLQMQLQRNVQSVPLDYISSLKSTVLQSLIHDEVLRQGAVSEGYRVSSLQTEDAVRKMPPFQVSGRFSSDRFQQLIAASDFTPASFLDQLGTILVIDQVKQGILTSAIVLPDEASRAAALVNQTRHFFWLLLEPDYLANTLKWHPVISEQDIQNFYQANPKAFQAPEQVSLDYLYLSEKNLPKPSSATDAASVYSRLKEKMANFTYEHPDSLMVAARELGLTVQSTGLFTREKGDKDPVSASGTVRQLAFSPDILNSGNNSDVIEIDPSTSVVIRINQHIPARLLPLNKVRPLVIAKLTALAMDKKLKDLATQSAEALSTGKSSMAQVAAQFPGLRWQDSGWVGRQAVKPAVTVVTSAFRFAVPAAGRMTVGVSQANMGYVLISLKEVRDGADSKNSTASQQLNDELESSYANAEYDMYKDSLSRQAKIKIKENMNS